MKVADAEVGDVIEVKLPGLRGDLVSRYLQKVANGFLDTQGFTPIKNLDMNLDCKLWGRAAVISEELGVRYYSGPKGWFNYKRWTDFRLERQHPWGAKQK
jgi:hypothetical protein